MKKKPDLKKCDGMRKDGTCGNGCCDNHNKKCLGAKCPERFSYQGEGYDDVEGAVAMQAIVPASATQRDAAGTVVATSQTFQTSQTSYRDRVSGQYAAIEAAKDNLLRECVKFGALLTEVGYYLGESRGRGKDGAGLQTWLEENCPEVNYSTAMNYKALATKCVKMLGGGSQAVAVLQDKTEVIPPGEDAPIEVESRFIEKRDNLFSEVKSRRELEQTYFKFMAHEGKGRQGGANKGQAGTGRRALTAVEKAEDAEKRLREIVGSLIAFDQGSNFMKIDHVAQTDIIMAIKDIVKSFEEQAG